jgi:hypothetical protein
MARATNQPRCSSHDGFRQSVGLFEAVLQTGLDDIALNRLKQADMRVH